MGTVWLPGFTRHPGNSSGTWAPDNEDAPKIVLHTTEGHAYAAALGAYRANNSWPHITVDPVNRHRYQHVPLDRPARALRNTNVPGETNREARVYQIEILGFAGQAHTWDDATLDWLGTDVLRPLAEATGTPLRTSVEFFGQDAGWTLASPSARQRLSAHDYDIYTGVLGHQHVPENSHWDPGALDVDRILAAARGTNPSEEDTDMTPEQADQLKAAVQQATEANMRAQRAIDILEGRPDNSGPPEKKFRPTGKATGTLLARIRDGLARVEGFVDNDDR